MSSQPDSAKIYGNVQIGKECIIGEFTIIGYSLNIQPSATITSLGDKCILGSYVIIHRGAQIGKETKIEDFCRIGENVSIGQNCYILYGAKIYDNAKVGNNSIIAGFICERAKIGSNVRIFGELLHSHREPHLGWDDAVEESPVIDDCVFVGFGAKVIGGIRIERNSYVAAGAVITKNVPPRSIVVGTNKIIPYSDWKGILKHSKFFKR